MVPGEGATLMDGARRVGEQRRLAFGVEGVGDVMVEAVGLLRVADHPVPGSQVVGLAPGVLLARQPGPLLAERTAVRVDVADRDADGVDLVDRVLVAVDGHVHPGAEQVLVERGAEAGSHLGREAVLAGFHTFRHTCASLLFAAGMNVKQVQAWPGHADLSFTVRTYIHLMDDGVGGADFLDEL